MNNNIYNNNKCLARIAKAIYDGDVGVLNEKGIKEIIILYLLIPYMTRDKLLISDGYTTIGIKSEEFYGIKIKDFRDALCHSFIFNCLQKNNPSYDDDYIAFDDRVKMDRIKHSRKGTHNDFYLIPIDTIDAIIENCLCEIE